MFRISRVLLLLLAANAAACDRGDDAQACFVGVLPEGTPTKLSVALDGTTIGTVWPDKRNLGKIDFIDRATRVPDDQPITRLCVPPGKSLLAGTLTIEVPTPCGKVTLGVTPKGLSEDDEAAVRKTREKRYGFVELAVELEKEYARTSVWLAPPKGAAKKTEVKVGEAAFTFSSDVDNSGLGRPLYDVTCSKTHPVTVDGKTIGNLEVDGDKPPRGVVVNASEGCFRFRSVRYTDAALAEALAGAGDKGTTLAGPVLKLTNVDTIDFFLKPAPKGRSADKKSSVIELAPVPCKPQKPKP